MNPRKWCAIDVEGDVGKLGLLGCAFYHGTEGMYLTDHDLIERDLVAYAEMGYTFIAHKADYDLSILAHHLHIPWESVYYNGRWNHGRWKYHYRKPVAELWDTLGLAGGLSIAKLGAAMGLPKLETPQRLLGKDPDRYRWMCERHGAGECEECYAVRDAEIIYHFMVSLTSTLAGWGVAPRRRISSLAVDVWRALDNPPPPQMEPSKTAKEIIEHRGRSATNLKVTEGKMTKLSRSAYYGGRVDTIKLGTIGPVYVADMCSMYPSLMRTTAYPDPRKMIYLTNPQKDVPTWDREGALECDVFVPPMHLPPLPYLRGGEVLYPVGRFRGCWTLLEMRYALSLGCRLGKVYRVAFSVGTVEPFHQFVDVLWELREAYERSKDPRSVIAKVLMNSLYGRLGMRELVKETRVKEWKQRRLPRPGELSHWETIGDRMYGSRDKDRWYPNPWINPLWAAYTTAAGRVALHRHMLAQGDNLIYADTDAVFSQAPIIGLGEGLGALRDQGSYRQAIIAGPKLYALQDCNQSWRARAKGVSREVALDFLMGRKVIWQEPITPIAAVRRNIPAGTWVDVTRERQHVPHRRQPTNPAALLYGGGWSDTVPPVIP